MYNALGALSLFMRGSDLPAGQNSIFFHPVIEALVLTVYEFEV